MASKAKTQRGGFGVGVGLEPGVDPGAGLGELRSGGIAGLFRFGQRGLRIAFPIERGAQPWIRVQNGHVDVVHLGEEGVRVDAMAQHQPFQRGSMLVEVALLQQPCLVPAQPQQLAHIGFHLAVDLRAQIGAGLV